MIKAVLSTVGRLFMYHPVAPYIMVFGAVESLILAYYSMFEPERLPFELTISGTITVLVAFPIIALVLRQHRKVEALKAELEWTNATDRMTGLLNRQAFLTKLEALLQSAPDAESVGAFAYVDADKFKQVNDNHGHHVGDRVLEMIGTAIRNSTREGDLAARLGGEEFGIFLPGASLDVAGDIAERLRRNIVEARMEGDPPLPPISVSIGVAAHKVGHTVAVTMQAADQSLYHAKQTGRNAVVVELEAYRVKAA